MIKDFIFLDPGKLVDDELELVLVKKIPANDERSVVPYYEFEMKNMQTRETMGNIRLRIGYNERIHYGGQIGYDVKEEFRGQRFAARACKLLLPFAKRNGLTELWLTCDPENKPSRRTVERLGAQLVEVVDLPEHNEQYQRGERQKCRYKIDL